MFFLVRNLILVILNHVVGARPEVLVRVADDRQHMGGRFLIVLVGHKALLQQIDGLAAEARQTGVEHQRYQCDDGVLVRSA